MVSLVLAFLLLCDVATIPLKTSDEQKKSSIKICATLPHLRLKKQVKKLKEPLASITWLQITMKHGSFLVARRDNIINLFYVFFLNKTKDCLPFFKINVLVKKSLTI